MQKNRIIKFRAWDEDGFMFYPSAIQFSEKLGMVVYDGDRFGQLGSGVVDLMQYIGFKDKNGTEIYEGDIIKINGESDLYEVFYNQNISGFDTVSVPIETADGTAELRDQEQNDIEVVSNIYEKKTCPHCGEFLTEE